MRVIKFRAKRVDSNEWVYGGGVITTANNITILLSLDERGEPCVIEVKPETVGQFIGFKDSISGKEVYEDDILRALDYSKRHEVVKFDKHRGNHSVRWVMGFEIPDEYEIDNQEVIGNRWDNPDLLKEAA